MRKRCTAEISAFELKNCLRVLKRSILSLETVNVSTLLSSISFLQKLQCFLKSPKKACRTCFKRVDSELSLVLKKLMAIPRDYVVNPVFPDNFLPSPCQNLCRKECTDGSGTARTGAGLRRETCILPAAVKKCADGVLYLKGHTHNAYAPHNNMAVCPGKVFFSILLGTNSGEDLFVGNTGNMLQVESWECT